MMAERLLGLGAAVEIWGRRGEVLAAAAAAMNARHPGMATQRVVDIKDPEAVEAAVAAMWAEGRPATHLINNAAGNFNSHTEDLSPRAFHAIAPGTIPTEGMFARLRPGEENPAARLAARNPMGRVGTAEDIGDLAAFLLTPVWINGETVALDGGQWLSGGGGFQDYLAWTDGDWAAAREGIKARNAADRAQRG